MSKLLGGVVLVFGTGMLGWYANGNSAVQMQSRITADAATVAQASVRGVSTEVSGRDIIVRGVADGAAEHEQIVAALNKVDGRRVVIDQLEVLDTVSPFEISSVKSADGQTYEGVLTSEAALSVLSEKAGDPAAVKLKIAAGVPDGKWETVALNAISALDGLQSGEMRLRDKALTVSGLAATPVEKAAAENILAQLPEGYSQNVNITSILKTAKPFTMRSTKTKDAQTYAGYVPNEAARAGFANRMGAGAADLDLAWGAPDDAWPDVANKGFEALDALEKGEMSLIDRKLKISGVALTPVEKNAAMAAVADLPDGYSAHVDIITIDDGKPAAYTILYHPVTGASVDGKLTNDMSTKAIAKALGVKRVAGDPVIAATTKSGTGDALKKQLGILAGWLPEFEGFALGFDGKNTTIDAKLVPGLDKDLVILQLSDAFGDSADLMITGAAEINVTEGTIRENLATGSEVYSAGFWLPVRKDFKVSAKSCEDQSAQALAKTKVNFLTGSAQLDARSVRAINNIAGVVLRCVTNDDLQVEIGGHTDSSGALQMNMDLSAARAKSVVEQLIVRGVPQTRIVAKGYGPTEPITGNDSAEGKAANRRTTVRWFKVEKEVEAPAPAESNTDTTVSE